MSDHDYNYLERQRQKGPEYLIIDNFAEYFQLEKSNLVSARTEAEEILENVSKLVARDKSDGVLFLKALDESDDSALPNINKIGKSMAAFRPKLNEISQAEFGNKKLRVDKEEIVYTRLISPYENMHDYRHHKDSYIHDPNNELDGMELRKLSMVVFLNDELSENEQTGMLRLYT